MTEVCDLVGPEVEPGGKGYETFVDGRGLRLPRDPGPGREDHWHTGEVTPSFPKYGPSLVRTLQGVQRGPKVVESLVMVRGGLLVHKLGKPGSVEGGVGFRVTETGRRSTGGRRGREGDDAKFGAVEVGLAGVVGGGTGGWTGRVGEGGVVSFTGTLLCPGQ